MRGTVAKNIRSKAEQETQGMPNTEYNIKLVHKSYIDPITGHTPYSIPIKTLNPGCTRFLYKQMKKTYKENKHV